MIMPAITPGPELKNSVTDSTNGVGVSVGVGGIVSGGVSGATTRLSGPDLTECAGCGCVIHDRYYLFAVDRQWHVHCLKCSQCKTPLDSELTCFSRDGHIYCKEDYYRIFAMKRCTRCGQGIYASELVMRVRDNIYHIQCFTCAWCNTTLSQGDYFGLKDRLVYCRTHYELLTTGHVTGNYQLTSENAIHPSHPGHGSTLNLNDHLNRGSVSSISCGINEPIIPSYGSIYSPGSTAQSNHNNNININIGDRNVNGLANPLTGGVRKGRPRKRKGTDGNGNGTGNVIATGNSLDNNSTVSLGGGVVSQHQRRTQNQSPTLGNITDGNSMSLNDGECLSDGQSSQLSGSMLSLAGGCVGSHSGGSQRTKRMRTSFKHHQLRTMKSYFSINQNPDAKDLKQLAQKTGLSKRVLQVWFQNARAKWRRNNLKLMGESVPGDLTVTNGQTSSSMSLTHSHPHSNVDPSTPSTGIASPNGSTRPFSSPSPSPLSITSHNNEHHQTGQGTTQSVITTTQNNNIEYTNHNNMIHNNHEHNNHHNHDSIIPLANFQELF